MLMAVIYEEVQLSTQTFIKGNHQLKSSTFRGHFKTTSIGWFQQHVAFHMLMLLEKDDMRWPLFRGVICPTWRCE